MFDVGFWELALVGVIALVVFGPERLPRLARETALWIRKARSAVASVREEINRELQLQELQQTLREQQRTLDLRQTIEAESKTHKLSVDRNGLIEDESLHTSEVKGRTDGEG